MSHGLGEVGQVAGADGMLNISLVDVDPEVLVDLRASELDGKQAEDRLHRVGITVTSAAFSEGFRTTVFPSAPRLSGGCPDRSEVEGVMAMTNPSSPRWSVLSGDQRWAGSHRSGPRSGR